MVPNSSVPNSLVLWCFVLTAGGRSLIWPTPFGAVLRHKHHGEPIDMATWEMQLVSRIVRTGELASVLSWGIGSDDFMTRESRAMFQMITSYNMGSGTAGSVLGENAVTQHFPNFVLCDDVSMTTEALCRQVRYERLNLQINGEVAKGMNVSDPMQRAQTIQAAMNDALNLGFGKTTDIRSAVGIDRVQATYALRRSGIDRSVGHWPWKTVDTETGGFRNDDYVVLFGRPKSFKTWILIYIIASLLENDKRVLIYTKEMTWEDVYERLACCLALIRHWNLRQGCLSHEEEELLEQVTLVMKMPEFAERVVVLSGLDAGGGDSIMWLRSKVDLYKPDFVAIDGLHLMHDARGAKKREERITNISRDARAMVLQTRIPLLVTVQANRAASKNEDADLSEIAYSDALGQDATVVMRTIKDKPTEDKPESTVSLVFGALRNGSLDGFRINAEPATDFSFHSKLSALDAVKVKDQDDKDAEAVTKKKAKKAHITTEAQAEKVGNRRAQQELDRQASGT